MTCEIRIAIDDQSATVEGLQGASAAYFHGLVARVAKALSVTPESLLAGLGASKLPTGSKLEANIHHEGSNATVTLTAAQLEALTAKIEKVAPMFAMFKPMLAGVL